MPKPKTFPINPDVMIWARDRLGLSVGAAARLLGVSTQELRAIEAGDIEPKVSLLETSASKYGLSLVTLLSPQRPRTFRKPKDYRTVGGFAPALSPASLRAIYEVQYYRHEITDVLEGLEEVGERGLPELPRKTRNENAVVVASEIRQRLGVSYEEQVDWAVTTAFSRWRWRVEQQGIFVFLRKMRREDCRGFCFWDEGLPPTVVINSTETPQARQYTLMHEYGHLLLRSPGICNEREDVDDRRDERWCNQFAANVLMPAALVEREAERIAPSAFKSKVWTVDSVERLARRLRVGRPAMAIRLEELNLSTPGLAGRLIPRWKAQWEEDLWSEQPELEETPRELRIPMATRTISTLGTEYPELVFHGVDTGVIDLREASHLLNTGTKHFPSMRELLMKRRESYV